MRFLFILLSALFINSYAHSQDTIPYIDNIPVLDGLQVMHDNILIFDKPSGQFVEVPLWCEKSCSNPHEIYQQYRKIFQNLGWYADDTMGFYKNGKNIYIELQQNSPDDPSLIVTFRSKS